MGSGKNQPLKKEGEKICQGNDDKKGIKGKRGKNREKREAVGKRGKQRAKRGEKEETEVKRGKPK